MRSAHVSMAMIQPRPTPRPPVEDGFYDQNRWTTLSALMEAAFPPISTTDSDGRDEERIRLTPAQYREAYESLCHRPELRPAEDEFAAYMAQNSPKSLEFQHEMRRVMSCLTPAQQKGIGDILALIS